MSQANQNIPTEPSDLAGRSILLVDHEPQTIEELRRGLGRLGLVVHSVASGKEALSFFQRQLVDLVLSRMTLPDMGGLELLQHLKDLSPTLPVILASEYQDTAIVVKALKAGADNFLSRPFTIDTLQRVLRRALTEAVPLSLSQSPDCDISQRTRMEVPSRPEYVGCLLSYIIHSAVATGFANNRLDGELRLALVEGITNAMEHGNRWDPESRITVEVEAEGGRLAVTITDQGPGFDWRGLPDPTDPQRLTQERGRGVYLMRTIMDRVEFNQAGNTVTLVKSGESD